MSKIINVKKSDLIEIILTKERRKIKVNALKIYKQIKAEIEKLSLNNLVGYYRHTKKNEHYRKKKKELPIDIYKITWEIVKTQNSTIRIGRHVIFMALNAQQLLWWIKPTKNEYSIISQMLLGSPEGDFRNLNIVKLKPFEEKDKNKDQIIPATSCKIITMADILKDPSVLNTDK